jgi:hypothetical protein
MCGCFLAFGSNGFFERVWQAGFGEVDLAKWIWQKNPADQSRD